MQILLLRKGEVVSAEKIKLYGVTEVRGGETDNKEV